MKTKKLGDEFIEKYDRLHWAHPQDETAEDKKFSAKRELKEFSRDAKFRARLRKELEEIKENAEKKEKFRKSLEGKTPDRERVEAEFISAVNKIEKESTCFEVAKLLEETLDECCQEAFLDLAERDTGTNRFYEGYERGYEKGHEHATKKRSDKQVKK